MNVNSYNTSLHYRETGKGGREGGRERGRERRETVREGERQEESERDKMVEEEEEKDELRHITHTSSGIAIRKLGTALA